METHEDDVEHSSRLLPGLVFLKPVQLCKYSLSGAHPTLELKAGAHGFSRNVSAADIFEVFLRVWR